MYRTMYGLKPIVRNAAKLAQSIIYKYKDRLQAGIIIAGIDDVEGPSIYEITLGGSMIKQNVCLGGSGSSYIYGYVDSNYSPDMTPEQGLDFVRRCSPLSIFLFVAVQLAISRDGHSGGIVRTAVIKRESVQRDFQTESDFVYKN